MTCICDSKDITEFKRKKKKAYNISFHHLHEVRSDHFDPPLLPFHRTEAMEIGQALSVWSPKTCDQIRASNVNGVL